MSILDNIDDSYLKSLSFKDFIVYANDFADAYAKASNLPSLPHIKLVVREGKAVAITKNSLGSNLFLTREEILNSLHKMQSSYGDYLRLTELRLESEDEKRYAELRKRFLTVETDEELDFFRFFRSGSIG